jgi:hypothetical protein
MTFVGVAGFVNGSRLGWMWLFYGALGFVGLSFWRFHEARAKVPTLRVYFDAEDTNVIAGVPETYYTHVKVENLSDNVRAQGCVGRITRWEERQESGDFARHPRVLSPVEVKWANEPHGSIDIEPRVPRRLDLVHAVSSQPDRINFFTAKAGVGIDTSFSPGVYRAEVRVSGANTRETATGLFEIDFRTWNRITVSELG